MDKVVIVTGGAGGIGSEICRGLAEDGLKVVVADFIEQAAARLAEEIRRGGGEAVALQVDVGEGGSVGQMVRKSLENYQQIDFLINGAGVISRFPVVEMAEEEWDRILRINLKGTFLCSQAAARQMVIQGGGAIINTVSQAGLSYSTWQGPHYHAAKAGVIHLTTVMAMELGPYNIRVNAVAPGFTESPSSVPLLSPPPAREIIVSQIPLGRLGTADDVVQAVLFLASDRAAYITGQTLVVNGGSPGFSRDPRQM